MEDKSNFVEYHVPCNSCGSSDARSINDDGSSYCFSCQSYFPSSDKDIQLIKERGDNMQEARQLNVTDLGYHAGVSSSIKDRGINEDTCKKYGVKLFTMAMV